LHKPIDDHLLGKHVEPTDRRGAISGVGSFGIGEANRGGLIGIRGCARDDMIAFGSR
jgi:hypothetical protein